MITINKKICLIGDFAVGKTSLTARFVKNIFSEKYLSTVGVKVDAKEIVMDSETILKLLIWDIAGKDKFTTLDNNYLKGSAGYLLVADSTRKDTIDTAFELYEHMQMNFNNIPFCMLINKIDLTKERELENSQINNINAKKWSLFVTSAKTGENVDTAFHELGVKLLS